VNGKNKNLNDYPINPKYMKYLRLFILFIILINKSLLGQTSSDILEDGITVEKNDNIFLKLSDKTIKYFIGEHPTRPVTLKDSVIFLVKNESVNIYLKPLNPLSYSYKSENKIIVDPVDEAAAKVFTSIKDLIDKVTSIGSGAREFKDTSGTFPKDYSFDDLLNLYIKIKDSLKNDYKNDINAEFKSLKSLSFNSEEDTKEAIAASEKNITAINAHFKYLEDQFKSLLDKTDSLNKDRFSVSDLFTLKYVFRQLCTELKNIKNEQYKRVKNLIKVFDLVQGAYKDAKENKDGLEWCVYLAEVPCPRGKISIFTVTIHQSGYRLSTDDDKEVIKDEIIEDEQKMIVETTIRVRGFQRFIPEVSVGIAYTTLNFPTYAVETDTVTEKNYVGEVRNEVINRINISAMLNYNFYIPRSPIHPFIQFGTGVNIDFPSLLLGTGLRINSINKTRFAFSIGFASTWIQTLQTLSVGDEIKDEEELKKDLKYEFNMHPKLYYGIQYNF